jgi:hypothetical protein
LRLCVIVLQCGHSFVLPLLNLIRRGEESEELSFFSVFFFWLSSSLPAFNSGLNSYHQRRFHPLRCARRQRRGLAAFPDPRSQQRARPCLPPCTLARPARGHLRSERSGAFEWS